MKNPLTQPDLIAAARAFCVESHRYQELFGATDGKAIGTFIEHKFRVLGYLTISNALQWRLQYRRVVDLKEIVSGIVRIV